MSERERGAPGHVGPEVLTEHTAPERLVVARGLFAGPSPRVPDELYARIVRGKAQRERHALHLKRGATVDTNNYFGRLPASYFQRWTTVTEVQLKLAFDTSGPAQLRLPPGSDSQGSSPDGREHGDRRHRDGRSCQPDLNRVFRRRRAVDGLHGAFRLPSEDHRSGVDGASACDDPAPRQSRSARSTGPTNARPPSPRSPATRPCWRRSTRCM